MLKYSNWFAPSEKTTVGCTYLQKDGSWQEGRTVACNRYTLCTICTITGTPVFTLKGACHESNLDWNYYMTVGNEYQIIFIGASQR